MAEVNANFHLLASSVPCPYAVPFLQTVSRRHNIRSDLCSSLDNNDWLFIQTCTSCASRIWRFATSPPVHDIRHRSLVGVIAEALAFKMLVQNHDCSDMVMSLSTDKLQ